MSFLLGEILIRQIYQGGEINIVQEPAKRYVQLLPAEATGTPPYSIGGQPVNIGVWAYAILTSKKLPPRTADKPSLYVLGSYETYPSNTAVLDAWVRAVGQKLPLKTSQTAVITISLEQFEQIWGPMGKEIGLMFKFWDDVKERCWDAAGDGDLLVPVQEIMDEAALAEQVGTEEVFKSLEWVV